MIGPTPVPQWRVRLVYQDNGREYVVNVYAPSRDVAIRRAIGQAARDHGGSTFAYTAIKTDLWKPLSDPNRV